MTEAKRCPHGQVWSPRNCITCLRASLDQALRERDEARGRLRDLGARNPAEVIRDGHCVVCGEGASPGEPDDPNWHTMPCIIRRLLLAEAAKAQRDRYAEALKRIVNIGPYWDETAPKMALTRLRQSAREALSNPTPPASSEDEG